MKIQKAKEWEPATESKVIDRFAKSERDEVLNIPVSDRFSRCNVMDVGCKLG
ncbi:UNVERIFIED_CONTAM: hypothetical protein FKN15_068904 [Acipenser sinensis]